MFPIRLRKCCPRAGLQTLSAKQSISGMNTLGVFYDLISFAPDNSWVLRWFRVGPCLPDLYHGLEVICCILQSRNRRRTWGLHTIPRHMRSDYQAVALSCGSRLM